MAFIIWNVSMAKTIWRKSTLRLLLLCRRWEESNSDSHGIWHCYVVWITLAHTAVSILYVMMWTSFVYMGPINTQSTVTVVSRPHGSGNSELVFNAQTTVTAIWRRHGPDDVKNDRFNAQSTVTAISRLPGSDAVKNDQSFLQATTHWPVCAQCMQEGWLHEASSFVKHTTCMGWLETVWYPLKSCWSAYHHRWILQAFALKNKSHFRSSDLILLRPVK